MVSIFNRLNTKRYRDHNEDSGLIKDRGQIKDKGQIKDRDQTEVFPIANSRSKLQYEFLTYEMYKAGQRPKNIKEGDKISIIEEKYVIKGGSDDEKYYSIDDTKFKTGTVKSIVPEGKPWPDPDGKGEHQKMKIVLTNIDSVQEILKDRVITHAFPIIGKFSEEHIIIDAAYNPSHYYSQRIVSGRRKRKRRTKKVKWANKPEKTPKKNIQKKTPKKKHSKHI